jgi:GntR family transcriptional regulator of vanillate catabolism
LSSNNGYILLKISTEVVTLAQSVADILRAEIVSGSLAPGEKLQEVTLAQRLGVSRTPIRAGLHSLASEGLLQYLPNRGYCVRALSSDRLIAIFDLRGVLEGLAARLAAENGMSETDEAIFRDALVRGDSIMAQGVLRASDKEPFGEINVQIHQIILNAAHDVLLEEMLLRCRNTPISSTRNVLWHDFSWVRRSHDDHYRLLDAILLRDGARAEQLMKEHVHAVKLQIKAELESDTKISSL